MKHVSGNIHTSDGCSLFWQSWSPDASARAAVFIIHGLADHSSRFAHVARVFAEQGISSFAIDLRGHGRSEGLPTFIWNFNAYILDMATGWEHMQKQLSEKEIPVFIYGHSMGSLVSVHFIDRHKPDIRGLITTAALVEVNPDLSPFLLKISGLLSALFPKLPTLKLDLDHLSTNPDIREKVTRDPLYYKGGLRARTGKEILKAAEKATEIIKAFRFPLLAMHGGDDQITKPGSSRTLADSVQSPDKELIIYPGAFHELVNETNSAEVVGKITDWILERT